MPELKEAQKGRACRVPEAKEGFATLCHLTASGGGGSGMEGRTLKMC
jgi:hypothetical protein